MKTFYPAIYLTGVTDECLDWYDGNILVDGDVGYVVTGSDTYDYTLDDSSGAAEDIPNVIEPNTNPGSKRWILNKSYVRADGTIPLTDDWAIGDYKIGINTVPSHPIHVVNSPGDVNWNTQLIDLNPTGTHTDDRDIFALNIDVDTDATPAQTFIDSVIIPGA